MKTKELVSRLKELGYFVERKDDGLSSEHLAISTADNCYLIATVSEKYPGVLNTDIYKGYNEKQEPNPIFRMLIKYAMTPLDEREDTKKYLVKLLPKGDIYLNQDKADKHIFSSSADETNGYKTEFTEEEYNDLRERYNKWFPKFDEDDPHFVEVQDDRNSELLG